MGSHRLSYERVMLLLYRYNLAGCIERLASCTCHVGRKGGFCKHAAKVMMLQHRLSARQVLTLYGTRYAGDKQLAAACARLLSSIAADAANPALQQEMAEEQAHAEQQMQQLQEDPAPPVASPMQRRRPPPQKEQEQVALHGVGASWWR